MITLKIIYRKGAKPIILNLPFEISADIDEVAKAGAKELTKRYGYWLKSSKNDGKVNLRKYEAGQYIMIREKLRRLV
jgi:hypothetical protein